ncbi:hypothetical protein QBC39DRAFT_36990 [Podospora conica]|nr:hypothetical protein QBC39DRAFT_36990 [Schizothecium conicum]
MAVLSTRLIFAPPCLARSISRATTALRKPAFPLNSVRISITMTLPSRLQAATSRSHLPHHPKHEHRMSKIQHHQVRDTGHQAAADTQHTHTQAGRRAGTNKQAGAGRHTKNFQIPANQGKIIRR